MKRREQSVMLFGAALLLLILNNMKSWGNILSSFLPSWEGFSATPYWDYKQWSWGYGTKVPGSGGAGSANPGGIITRSKAMQQALQHINTDYLYLKPLLSRQLTANQWSALLSFSYNLGPGNADNLIPNINNNNLAALETQWKSYINAGGVPNSQLIARRAAEWNLFVA
jgi:lysozyme